MGIFSRKKQVEFESVRKKSRFYQKTWFKVVMVVLLMVVIAGAILAYKTGSTLSQISTKDSILSSLWKTLPVVGGSNELAGEKDGQINILLLGMRGNNMPGGGLLADSIMVASVKPKENKVLLLSIPRDLYVDLPDQAQQSKINAVHSLSEDKGEGKGMEAMKKVVSDVTGLPIHYVARLDFKGFKDLVDTINGVDIYLEKPFSEPKQFEGESALDFSLPAGKNHIDGQTALFFVRARFASSDFERAKRQQQVLLAIKDKLLSLGTLSDFSKVNNIRKILGEDVRTDMDTTEMKKMFALANEIKDPQVKQKVLDTSEEGLLYSSRAETPEGKTYILLPVGGNYDKIHQEVQNLINN